VSVAEGPRERERDKNESVPLQLGDGPKDWRLCLGLIMGYGLDYLPVFPFHWAAPGTMNDSPISSFLQYLFFLVGGEVIMMFLEL
jgi:hypothetical protein